jgi:hypothetical protein
MAPRMLILALLVLLVGCGSESGGASGAAIEELMKREIAKGLLAEYAEKPSEAEISRVAAKLDVSCEAAEGPDYACATDYGEELGVHHCTVRPNPAMTRIESSRCGGAKAPVTEEQFVDCATVGPVVSATDPEGDVGENSRPLPPHVAASPELRRADLRAVRVAAAPDRLCVQWETAAPIGPEHAFNFWVRPLGGGAQQGISLTVSFEPGQAPDVGTGPYGSTSGQVGVAGNVTSVTVEADDLAEPLRGALARPFTFAAHDAWPVRREHPDQAYGDFLDVAGGEPSYPPATSD